MALVHTLWVFSPDKGEKGLYLMGSNELIVNLIQYKLGSSVVNSGHYSAIWAHVHLQLVNLICQEILIT